MTGPGGGKIDFPLIENEERNESVLYKCSFSGSWALFFLIKKKFFLSEFYTQRGART